MRSAVAFAGLVLCAVALAACASHLQRSDQPAARGQRVGAGSNPAATASHYEDDLLIALSFSGGGTRAAAFSHGVLIEMDGARMRGGGVAPRSRRFRVGRLGRLGHGGLLRAEEARGTRPISASGFCCAMPRKCCGRGSRLSNISARAPGGVNDATGFTHWLDENLFQGATFAAYRADRRPRVWINASDIYNRTTFVFGQTAFSAMCSDLNAYPIADAVAASAAVPVVFAPVVIRTYPGACNRPLPEWIERARNDPATRPDAQVVRDRHLRATTMARCRT